MNVCLSLLLVRFHQMKVEWARYVEHFLIFLINHLFYILYLTVIQDLLMIEVSATINEDDYQTEMNFEGKPSLNLITVHFGETRNSRSPQNATHYIKTSVNVVLLLLISRVCYSSVNFTNKGPSALRLQNQLVISFNGQKWVKTHSCKVIINLYLCLSEIRDAFFHFLYQFHYIFLRFLLDNLLNMKL